MGVIDEVKQSDSNKDKSSVPIDPSLSTSKNGSGEVSVPQMLITSAEEVNQEIDNSVKEQNVADEKPSLTTIKEENEEEKETKERRDVLTAQQRPLVISAIVEESHEAVDESLHDPEIQPRTESPPLSAIQRPLMLEQIPPHAVASEVQETQQEPIHVPSTSPSAVQRPLVLDGSSVPFDLAERGISSQIETEINVGISGQNGTMGFSEPSTCPVLSARIVDEGGYDSYESKGDTAGHDARPEEEFSSSLVGNLDSSSSKLKGFFTKADGTSIFSLPKFNIGSSKEHDELSKEEKDASQIQVTSGETPVESENVPSTDKKIEAPVKEDNKSAFSLPKFSFGSFRESKSKEHSQDSSTEVHPDSTAISLDDDAKEHSKDGSKVTFSLPKFGFSGSKETKEASKEQHDSPLNQSHESQLSYTGATSTENYAPELVKEESKHGFHLPKFSFGSSKENKEMPKEQRDSTQSPCVESHPSSAEGADHEGYSPEISKEGSKHGFHLPKFSFGHSKENKEISKEQLDSTVSQSVESRPSSTEVADCEGYSPEISKEGSKHGFHLPKFSFGSSKENKEILKEQLDSPLSQGIENRPSSAEVADREGYSAEISKEGSKHGFHLPKFSFGSSKESKEMPKEQHVSSPNHTTNAENLSSSIETAANLESCSAEAVKEGSVHGFSLPKFTFGISKEHKEVSKLPKDGSMSHSISVEKSPSSVPVIDPETTVKDVKEDGKHTFQFPKFSFGSSKEQKQSSQEPSAAPVPATGSPTDSSKMIILDSDSKHCSPESGKTPFSLPKFSFGISKEHKVDSKESKSPSSEDHPVSVEISEVDVDARDVTKEESKHSFSFPKFSRGSPKSPTKEPKHTAESPAFVVDNHSFAGESKVDVGVNDATKESSKHSFSFPKFNFGSSKEDGASKEPKDSSKVPKSDTEAKLAIEDNKHTFSFPKFGLSSSKDSKEIAKHPKDGIQPEVDTAENFPVSSGSVDAPAGAKPFSFPKISFGSFREHKGTPKVEKDLESCPSAHENYPGVVELKGSDTGGADVIQKPEQTALKDDDSKILEAKKAVTKGAPLASEEKDPFKKAKKSKEIPERASSFKMLKKESKETEKEPKNVESPSSLYETCCMRLAGMICNKAMEIVSEHTTKRGPPKKPPKPTAETIAKARAAIVAKRVREYEKRRNFGDDLPLGYNGIRFVDDDTESSTDYKDVDNTAYIIDSDCSIIVRRMKSENSCPSTCSGISSYYTADEMTLKDGNFSDNTLESVSLGSQDSLVYKSALSSTAEEPKFSPTGNQIDFQKTVSVKKPVERQKSSPSSFFFFNRNKSAVSTKEIPAPVVQKRVPPPVPPKPRNWPRSESQVKLEAPALKPEVQKCVDSLSLSPRPVIRNLPATSGIKQRPLTIAGIKETEFPMYMRNIRPEESPKKPVLTTVVKNQSLQKVPVISASTSALDNRSLSSPPKSSDIQAASASSLTTKTVPQRPPPPTNYIKSSSAQHIEAAKEGGLPDAVSKPKAAISVVSPQKPAYKPRPHISPPRPPPPPQIKVASSRPPRPPPPSSVIADKISQSIASVDTMQFVEKPLEDSSQAISENLKTKGFTSEKEVICDKSEIAAVSQTILQSAEVPSQPVSHFESDTVTNSQQSDLETKLEARQKADVTPPTEHTASNVQSANRNQTLDEVMSQNVPNAVDIRPTAISIDTLSGKHVKDIEQSALNNQIVNDKLPKSDDYLNENAVISKPHVEDGTPIPSARVSKKPKPPPRTRRIRSRTVEIVSVVWKPEEGRRRSQSLSEMDARKIADSRDALQVEEKHELKALYTSVHKDPAKNKSEQRNADFEDKRKSPSPEKISSRPLPPPPPPPRSKHHSESQKSKLSITVANKNVPLEVHERYTGHKQEEEAEKPIKPPVRKKKEEKLRSQSLEDKDKGTKTSLQSGKTSVSIDRAHSFTSGVPKKPRRKPKISSHEFHFDENANIAESIVESPLVPKKHHTTRSHSDLVISSDSKNYVKEQRSSSEKQIKRRSPAFIDISSKKSHSSWYDESDVSGDLGDVDTLPGSLKTSMEKLNSESKNSDTEGVNPNKNKQLRAKQDSVKKPRETSKFYVDIDANALEETPISKGTKDTDPHISHGTVDKETSPLLLERSEKSVQTSLETLSQGMVSRSEQSDDTDELLDLAQTLQDELKTILNRHKKQGPEGESDNDTSGSQNQFDVPGTSFEKAGPSLKRRERKPHSTRATVSSDLWQVSSSDESDDTEDQMKIPSETLSERKRKKVFYIAQEIMTSEEAFVDALKLLNIDFRNVVDEANKQKGSPVVPSDVMNQILNHLPQLQHLNENLLMELKDRIQHWDNLGKIADVIVKMGPFLKLYSWYIQDFESMVALLDDTKKKYPLFSQIVKEFENTPRCNRLALNHYMLKPVQRIPQYRLLLQEYLHNLPKDSSDYNDTLTALQIVSEVANHANESMKQGDNFQKLISIQNSIIGHKEIIKPGRVFVKEGELMKLSRKGMQPRWFVLLSDVLLYLTPVQQGLFRVNHELTLTGMKVAIPIQQDYQNEFSIISVTRSFTLAAKSPEERQEWIIALTKAIEENASKRSTFTNVRLQQKSEGGIDEDDDESFVLGRKAPVWIPDARVTMCQLCTSEFTVTFRRHHCRACGKVVCSVCSSNRAALHYLGNRNARVCDECYIKLEQGSGGGYTESGETDSDNQQIAVKAHLRTDSRHGRKPKRQLPSVLKEVCANDQGSSISGYLLKKSGKSWKRDWFVVKDNVLYEYKASEDVAALRSLPLLGYQIETFSESFEGIDSSLLFQLTHPGQPPTVFHADNTVATERWISALKEATILE